MNLFQLGDFCLHSGLRSAWKIDTDALSDADWMALAVMALERVPHLQSASVVEGVPRGGLKLALALRRRLAETPLSASGKVLLVDDVFTTGGSIEKQRAGRDAMGLVAFARGPVAPWVTALFQMPRG